MKHWMMLQGYTAFSTMYRKTQQKQTTFVSPKGNEKEIDYILTKRTYLRYNEDAEANDMIHMGSDHRCFMATFTITTPGKNIHSKTTRRKQDTIEYDERDQEEKQRLKELSKCIKKSIRDKKRVKRQQLIQRILKDFKGVSSIPGIKSAKKKVLITKITNERGGIITSRKGIASVFGEFHKKIYDDNEQDEYGNESSIDVHNNDTEENDENPRDHD